MQKRFVSIWFPHLVSDWFQIDNPALKNKAFVVRKQTHGRMLVVEASPAVIKEGVAKGMVLADAKAIHPDLLVFDEKPGLEEKLLSLLALWAIRFTPFAAIDLPNGLLLDASGCAHLWGGEEVYLKEINRRLTERGYHVRVAMADTIGAAWALARYNKDVLLASIGEHQKHLLSLSIASLRLDTETVERLNKLGLRQVSHLLNLPRRALRSRFGDAVLQRIDQALGNEEENIQPVRPVEPFQERLPCVEPIITMTGVELALEKLLEQVCARLKKEEKGLRTATLRAYQVNGAVSTVAIGTSGASNNPQHLFRLFEIKLPIIQLESGIELFVLEAKGVEPLQAVQEVLWDSAPTHLDKQLAELLDRLSIKFGSECIHRYLPAEHHWPERSFRKAQSIDERTAIKWQADRPRPVLLLKKPVPVQVAAPIPDYPPLHFRYRNKVHKISKADGPERIEREWWIEGGEHRDYYLVEDEEGARYWLYRLGHYEESKAVGWFLHGFFA